MAEKLKVTPLPYYDALQIVEANRKRCEAKVAAPPAQRGRNKKLGDACHRFAKVEVNGKCYCLRHGQSMALALAMAGKK